MIVLGLITSILLRALTAQAFVVERFEDCGLGFFYQDKEPRGMDQNAEKICQFLENEENIHYATLYSVYHKIPLYSAYTLDPRCFCDTKRKDTWHLEPQLSQSPIPHMVREDRNTQNLYKANQAISSDYKSSGYDRGHLNPNCFQCSEGRTATFTLTNAAPMIQRFNRVHWKNWEITLRAYLIKKLAEDHFSATAFIVTGTVPDLNVRIQQGQRRVTVPSHIWTAVCYIHDTDDTKSFSFGFIGRNHPTEPNISVMSVSQLNRELNKRIGTSSHFNSDESIQIFVDDCFDYNDEVQDVFARWILPVSQLIPMSSDSYSMNTKTGKITFDSTSPYYSLAEDLKVFTEFVCPITYAERKIVRDDFRKRDVSSGSDTVECQLVSEKQKTAADGSLCKSVSESGYSCRCDTGSETKLCCASPCLYQVDLKGYRCYSDRKLIDCSPHYSLITVNGERCRDDHPCGKYGYDYYWCKTGHGIFKHCWDYCSPPLWYSKTINGHYCHSNHACAKYGYSYTWCYTDVKGNWDYC